MAITASTGACRTPTQVTLDVTYRGGACSDLRGVAFIVATDPHGAEARIATDLFTTVTTDCTLGLPGEPQRVGTLVVTPNDDSNRASIIVLTSIDKRVEECTPADGYFGCIVARRAFSFVDHTSLTMEISLDLDCKNVPCDAVSTCAKGTCVDSAVPCTEDGCGPPIEQTDAGAVDAPTTSDAYVQGDTSTTPPTDAPIDSPADGPLDSSVDSPFDAGFCEMPKESVACTSTAGGAAARCTAAGTTCCSAVSSMDAGDGGTSSYACRFDGACANTIENPRLACRSAKNCPGGQVCCSAITNSGSFCTTTCGPDAGFTIQLCEDSCECRAPDTKCSTAATIGTAPPQPVRTCVP